MILLLWLWGCAGDDDTSDTRESEDPGSWHLSFADVTLAGPDDAVVGEGADFTLTAEITAWAPTDCADCTVAVVYAWDDAPSTVVGCEALGVVGVDPGATTSSSEVYAGPQAWGERTLHAALASDGSCAAMPALAVVEVATVTAVEPERLYVLTTSPEDGDTDVETVGTVLDVRFTQALDPDTVAGKLGLVGPDGPYPLEVTSNGNAIFGDPGILVPMGTVHTVTVATGIEGIEGQRLVVPHELTFETELFSEQVWYELTVGSGTDELELYVDPDMELAVRTPDATPERWRIQLVAFTTEYSLETERLGTSLTLSGPPSGAPALVAGTGESQRWTLVDVDGALRFENVANPTGSLAVGDGITLPSMVLSNDAAVDQRIRLRPLATVD